MSDSLYTDGICVALFLQVHTRPILWDSESVIDIIHDHKNMSILFVVLISEAGLVGAGPARIDGWSMAGRRFVGLVCSDPPDVFSLSHTACPPSDLAKSRSREMWVWN